jgi:hypothetical protein
MLIYNEYLIIIHSGSKNENQPGQNQAELISKIEPWN